MFLSACGVFIAVSLRVRGKVTTKQPQCAPNDEGKLAALWKHNSLIGVEKKKQKKNGVPSTQLHAVRRVGAAHLVWQRSSKSEGLKESDRLKEQLNYEAWMPRRGKRKHAYFFPVCLYCLDVSSLYEVNSCWRQTWGAQKLNCHSGWRVLDFKPNSDLLLKTILRKKKKEKKKKYKSLNRFSSCRLLGFATVTLKKCKFCTVFTLIKFN